MQHAQATSPPTASSKAPPKAPAPGVYDGRFFPAGTAVLIDASGTAWKLWSTGERAAWEGKTEWVVEFIAAGDWWLRGSRREAGSPQSVDQAMEDLRARGVIA